MFLFIVLVNEVDNIAQLKRVLQPVFWRCCGMLEFISVIMSLFTILLAPGWSRCSDEKSCCATRETTKDFSSELELFLLNIVQIIASNDPLQHNQLAHHSDNFV